MVFPKLIKTYCTLPAQEGLNYLIKKILGEKWSVVDPLSIEQINYIAVHDIVDKYEKLNKSTWVMIGRFLHLI